MNTTELAWAAGVYDGEGSASTYLPKLRKTRVRQMAVYQSGDAMPPPLLFRFRSAVGEIGLIHGPARGSLYQWHSKRHVVVEAASELLWPWIGEVKRTQLLRAASQVGRVAPSDRPRRWSRGEEAAWAAGFFDGEGTIGVEGHPRRPAVAMAIPQASASAVPETLERFCRIVGAATCWGHASSQARGRSHPILFVLAALIATLARLVTTSRCPATGASSHRSPRSRLGAPADGEVSVDRRRRCVSAPMS